MLAESAQNKLSRVAADQRALEHSRTSITQAESALGKTTLSEAVARYLFKLMAYKDEYEVARLHTDPAFHQRIADMFEGDFKLNYHLAPPLLAKKNDRGELIKQKYGPAMLTAFKWLAKFRRLRGTRLDVFGYSEERRGERRLIEGNFSALCQVISIKTAEFPLRILWR